MRKTLEWHFFDTNSDSENDRAWAQQTRVELPSNEAETSHVKEAATDTHKKTRYLVELLIGIALCYGIAVYLIWQQSTQRVEQIITDLTYEVEGLRHDLAPLQAEQTTVVENKRQSDSTARLPSYLETDHLRFVVGPTIDELVQQIAPTIEANYVQLHHTFGFTVELSVDKPTIFVDLPTSTRYPFAETKIVIVSRLDTYTENYQISAAEALTTQLTQRLAAYLIASAAKTREIKPQWESMVSALQLYVQLDNGFDAQWRQKGIALAHRHQAQFGTITLVHDRKLSYLANDIRDQATQPSPVAEATATSVVEFIFERYGYKQVGPLLDAFAVDDSWTTLVPRLFHTSIDEFEEQWHIYLRLYYPAPTE